MKFTLSWLKKYLETDATLPEILDELTKIGIEVEKVEDRAKGLENLVIAKVVACNKHPEADRLNVTTVDTGSDKLQVVCGAPNCQLGLVGVFAPAGTYIPGIDVTLKKATIRGQESNGMLCSEKELGISEEHDGIISLSDDLEIGQSAVAALGLDDPVIEIEVTPNRGDWSGIYGIARDLAATGIGTLKAVSTDTVPSNSPSPISVTIADEAKIACPHFMARTIKNVKNGPSPKWLQDQLTAIGLRPISALVDITNYFCVGYGRPLHVFDADKLKGDLHIRLSKAGEELEALNDKEYKLEDGAVAVCDDNGVLGLGGIVGGVPSGCTNETVNVVLEAAYFEPVGIAKTGRKLGVNSDARYRFERTVDPAFTAVGVELATQMILDLCGGDVCDVTSAGAAPEVDHVIAYEPSYTEKLSGCDVAQERQKEILEILGCDVAANDDQWQVKIPSWRTDMEGKADVVEEVIRIHGFDNIPATPMPRPLGAVTSTLTETQKRLIKLRHFLAGRGMCEAVTYAFMSSKIADLFGVDDHDGKESLRILKPISSEWDMMRPSILPNLIEAAGRNAARGFKDVALFEIGGCYRHANYGGQHTVAAGLRAGANHGRHWASDMRDVDAMDIKADVLASLEQMGINTASLQVKAEAPSWFHPGRSAGLYMGKNCIAVFGELHPMVLDEMKVSGPVAGFEIFVDLLPIPKKKSAQRKALKLSMLQPVSRDFAFVIDRDVKAGDVMRAAQSVDKKLITNVEIFDVYEGKGIEDGKKSYAVTLTLQPMEATLTDEEIEELSQKVVAEVEKKTGGVLRG